MRFVFGLIILTLFFTSYSAYALSDIRPPGASIEKTLPPLSEERKLSSTDWAAWVQAVGTILAVFAAISINVYSHYRDKKNLKKEAQQRYQRILSGLYVEIFAHAARCARDAFTWLNEDNLENNRAKGETTQPRRTIKNLQKFTPSHPVVYPALAENHGLLDPAAQAALSEFYFRIQLIIQDVQRFSSQPHHTEMQPDDTKHFANTLFNACKPAKEAIAQLRSKLNSYSDLDIKLNESYSDIFNEPTPMGKTIDEVLSTILKTRETK